MIAQGFDQREWCCADCGATPEHFENGPPVLTCESTCPALADATASQRADARFFEENPDATEFTRPANWTERTILINGGMSPATARTVRVRVTQVWPGFRVKQPLTPGQVTR